MINKNIGDTFVLIGNPNTGKTTIFNALTGAREHVGNWHGVTVDSVAKHCKTNSLKNFSVVDLPGVYSFKAGSFEEQVSIDFVNNNREQLFVNVCDSIGFRHNLLLTLSLLARGIKKIALIVNEFRESPIKFSLQKLSNFLNLPIFKVDATNKKNVTDVFKIISKINWDVTNHSFGLNYNSAINNVGKINIGNSTDFNSRSSRGGNLSFDYVGLGSSANSLKTNSRSIVDLNTTSESVIGLGSRSDSGNNLSFGLAGLGSSAGVLKSSSKNDELNFVGDSVTENHLSLQNVLNLFKLDNYNSSSLTEKKVSNSFDNRSIIKRSFSNNISSNSSNSNSSNTNYTDIVSSNILQKQYACIDKILSDCSPNCNVRVIDKNINSHTKLSFLENVFSSKWLAFPCFFIFLFIVFWLTFGIVGDSLSRGFSFIVVDLLGSWILDLLSKFDVNFLVFDFVQQGLLLGVGTVLSFLPQLVLLMLLFNILDDFGFFSYMAFTFDGFMKKIGLSGKSVFALMLGFGCNTSAVAVSRNLDTFQLRKKTLWLIPYFNCSAKLPIILVIASFFFSKYKYLIVFALYLLCILLAVVVSILSNLFTKKHCESSDLLVMEMPRIRFPKFSKICKDAWFNCKDFIGRVGFVVLVSSAIIWFFVSFSFSFDYVGKNSDNSILAILAKTVSPLFNPIGLGYYQIIIALFCGLLAKELILSSLIISCGSIAGLASLGLSSASIFSLLVFIVLYTPCIACLSSIKKEFGFNTMLWISLSQLAVAYFVAFICFIAFSSLKYFVIIFLFLSLLAFCLLYMVKYLRKTRCQSCLHKCK